MAPSKPRIAVVGGGPAGLTTGLLLHNRGIPFTIFELRGKPTDEELSRPSGMLDLHDESGLAAIGECALTEDFAELTGECSQTQKISDKDGNILYSDDGGPENRPEISRHNLTKMLMARIPPEKIRWNHRLDSVRSSESSGHATTELDFGSNGKHTFDLVIGADGAWSKVRNLLTNIKPSYIGTQYITLTICDVTRRYPHLAELVGSGSFSALANHHGVMTQRGPQDSVRVSVFITNGDEHFASSANLHTPSAAKSKLLEDDSLLGSWGPKIKDLVSSACDEEMRDNREGELDIRPMYTLPVGVSWEHRPGVTAIGDASHLMGPWAGEGVNLAMWDSLDLVHAISKAYETAGTEAGEFQKALDPLLKRFEEDMAARAKEKAEEVEGNGKMLFCEDAAEAFVDFFKSVMPPEA